MYTDESFLEKAILIMAAKKGLDWRWVYFQAPPLQEIVHFQVRVYVLGIYWPLLMYGVTLNFETAEGHSRQKF